MKTNIENLSSLNGKNWEGYIWMSDQEYPIILPNNEFVFNDNIVNPFIVEGLLYSKADNISVLIRHTGQLLITQYELGKIEGNMQLKDELSYQAFRLGNDIKKLKFRQLWVSEADPFCCGMKVFKMKAQIFTGFSNGN